jgi:dolichyl-phosphate beta-glucosyltransferase
MYNEKSIARDTVKTLGEAMKKISAARSMDIEVIFSDDGSTDGCADVVRSTAEELGYDFIRVVGYEHNRGKGAAVRNAVAASTGDIVMYTDCDLAYGTDAIGDIPDYMTPDADAVIGSRNLRSDGYEGYTFLRRLASKVYIKVLCILAGFSMTDSQCGFKAFRGELARKVFAECEIDGFAFDFEVLVRVNKHGGRIVEMPVKIINHRQSTVHVFSDSFKMLSDLIRIKKSVGK